MEIINASTKKHFEDIAKLSKIVWHHTYDSIIGYDQVEYMTDKFQSKTAIERDINDNLYEYLVIYKNNELVAYSGARPDKDNRLFLSKVYVSPDFQGQSFGKTLINTFIKKYKSKGFSKIWLTVNKNNTKAINIYKKIGFIKIDSVVTDIGNGFVMDDYIMEKDI